jgi:hypothetical protein
MITDKLLGSRSLRLALGLGALLATALPAYAAVWVRGHWAPGGVWVPGHWAYGVWYPGHWVIAP